jgi:REP element-mobilizing transposase RayT
MPFPQIDYHHIHLIITLITTQMLHQIAAATAHMQGALQASKHARHSNQQIIRDDKGVQNLVARQL